MPTHRYRATVLTLALLVSCSLASTATAEPIGTWLTQNGDARVRVARCGRSMCGTIIWLKEPINPATGRPHVDDKNPDPKQRNRKIVGMRIFAMAPEPQGSWSGPIYNSDDGQTYAGKLFLRGPTQLEVAGCAGALCGSEMWSKAGR